MIEPNKNKSNGTNSNLLKKQKNKNSKNKKSYEKIFEMRVKSQKSTKINHNPQQKNLIPTKNDKNNQQNDHNNFNHFQEHKSNQKKHLQAQKVKQRRKSSTISNKRPQSRISSKRFSSISTKSQINLHIQHQKENNKNKLNHNNQKTKNNEAKKQKTNFAKQLNCKKNELIQLNKKGLSQNIKKVVHNKNIKEKKDQKNVDKFNKKLSQYLNQKNIFSTQFQNKINQKQNQLVKSHSSSKDKPISRSRKQNKQQIPNNLFDTYNFYKKTFDINLKNCVKKGSTFNQNSKSGRTSQKISIRPSSSSAIISSHKNKSLSHTINEKQVQKRYQSAQLYKKSLQLTKRSTNFQKINAQSIVMAVDPNQIQIQMFCKDLNKRQKCYGQQNNQANKIVQQRNKETCGKNSQSSTKDNIFMYNLQKINISLIENSQHLDSIQPKNTKNTDNNSKRCAKRKSSRDLIIYNCRSNQFNQSSYEKSKSSVNQSQKCRKNKENDKIEVGQSNLEILQWSSHKKLVQPNSSSKKQTKINNDATSNNKSKNYQPIEQNCNQFKQISVEVQQEIRQNKKYYKNIPEKPNQVNQKRNFLFNKQKHINKDSNIHHFSDQNDKIQVNTAQQKGQKNKQNTFSLMNLIKFPHNDHKPSQINNTQDKLSNYLKNEKQSHINNIKNIPDSNQINHHEHQPQLTNHQQNEFNYIKKSIKTNCQIQQKIKDENQSLQMLSSISQIFIQPKQMYDDDAQLESQLLNLATSENKQFLGANYIL